MNKLIQNEAELKDLAEKTLQKIKQTKSDKATVLALYGDLGSGKTTFTKQLALLLDIKETITSPTFVIIKSFEIPKENPFFHQFKKLIHIDTYRLDLAEELEHLGFSDLMANKENLIVIEWPEILEEVLPKNRINLKFKFIDHTTREVEFYED